MIRVCDVHEFLKRICNARRFSDNKVCANVVEGHQQGRLVSGSSPAANGFDYSGMCKAFRLVRNIWILSTCLSFKLWSWFPQMNPIPDLSELWAPSTLPMMHYSARD